MLVGVPEAQARCRDGGGWRFGDRHPYVQSALAGGGIGAVVGGLIDRDGDFGNGAIRGAVVGSAAGLGTRYISRYDRPPGFRNAWGNGRWERRRGGRGNAWGRRWRDDD
jgi:hypothetical protein